MLKSFFFAFLLLSLAGARSYAQTSILNQTTPQTANFNITGMGTAGHFSVTQSANGAGSSFYYLMQNNIARWGLGTAEPENTTNLVGSDFTVYPYDNSGVYQGVDFWIERQNGYVGIGRASYMQPQALLHLKMPAAATNSTLELGYPGDAGTTAVPMGAVTGGYNIDFNTWRDNLPSQIGARIRAERLNDYEANSALVQSMDLAFYTSDGWLQTNLAERLRIKSNGFVGIGTSNPQSLLAVSGTVTAKQVTVTQTGWSDFVFDSTDSTYQRPTLSTVNAFIHQNKHLPGLPSAAEVAKNGLDLGDMQKLQLQKIEELTLYQVEANENISRLQAENETLKAELEQLKDAVKKLQDSAVGH